LRVGIEAGFRVGSDFPEWETMVAVSPKMTQIVIAPAKIDTDEPRGFAGALPNN
jgi:hypothetical protein